MQHFLEPHQLRALRYAKSRRRIALFMEMRLGKSPVAIRWAKYHRLQRVLLVAPLSTLLGELNWYGELVREQINPVILSALPKDRRWSKIRPTFFRPHRTSVASPRHCIDCGLTTGSCLVSYPGRPVLFRPHWATGWFAVNYEALRTQPELLSAPWDGIILDESTRIRTPQAQITKTLLKHCNHIPYRAILTGLPNPESVLDYFCQFVFLEGKFLGYDNYWKFRHRMFYHGFTGWDWQPKRSTRDKVKRYVHEHAFVLTRKAAGIGSEKVRQQRSVSMNAQQRKLVKEARTLFSVDGVETKWRTVTETWMQRIAGGFHPTTLELISEAKIRLAESLIMEEFRRASIVVWFRFNKEILTLRRWLRRRHTKLHVEAITGKTDVAKRPRIQERFHDGTTRVLLMQVDLGRYGWNLSRSSTVLYYSNSYEFEDRSQSEDRVIHLKKRDRCLYVDLVTLGTPDEAVVTALQDKRITARQFNTRLREGLMEMIR